MSKELLAEIKDIKEGLDILEEKSEKLEKDAKLFKKDLDAGKVDADDAAEAQSILDEKRKLYAQGKKEAMARLSEIEAEFEKEVSDVEGVAREAVSGATFSISPYIEAGIKALMDEGMDYGEALDLVKQEMQMFAELDPKKAMAAGIGGGLLTGGAGASLAKKAGLSAAKKASAALAGGAVEGGLATGVYQEDPSLGDIAMGAGVGTAGAGVGLGIPRVAEAGRGAMAKLVPNRKELARGGALVSLGRDFKDVKVPDASKSLSELQDLADLMLDEDLVRFTQKGSAEALDNLKLQKIDDVDNVIRQATEMLPKFKVKRNAIAGDIISDIKAAREARGGGGDITPDEIASLKRFIRQEMKRGKEYSIKEMQDLRRDLNKRIKTRDILAPSDRKLALRNEAKIALARKLGQHIKEGVAAAGFDAGEAIDAPNMVISKVMKASDVIKRGQVKDLTTPVGTKAFSGANLTRIGIAGGAGYAHQSVWAGIAMLGAFKAIDEFGDAAVAKALAPYKIARKSSEIINNKDLVMAKIMSSLSSRDPVVQQESLKLVDAISKADSIQQIQSIMPQVVQTVPDLFMPSAAASEFDGRVTSLMEKQAISKTISRNKDVTNTQKMRALDTLHDKGKLDDLPPVEHVKGQAQSPLSPMEVTEHLPGREPRKSVYFGEPLTVTGKVEE